ncbi:alpha/beta fold hydrolase [Streptosporangium sp. NPDC002544]|uniref:alpha/beta fold hydrolase n=1 Tax=Streptosporangium sp. NPDC002544 TaxID=3154538 RepID=UPI0033234E6B
MERSPVLLLHGFASSSEHGWSRAGWLDILADEGRQVIPVDLPGHGTAPRPHDPAEYANVDESVLDAITDHPVVDAVGFSAGAHILLGLASRHPDRFRRLVLIGIGGDVLDRQVDVEPLARALTGAPDPEDVVATLFRRLADTAGNDPLALAAFLRRPSRRPEAADLAKVTCPVLVVIGERDPAGPADPLVAALPDARLRVLPGVDHFAAPSDMRCVQAAVEFVEA